MANKMSVQCAKVWKVLPSSKDLGLTVDEVALQVKIDPDHVDTTLGKLVTKGHAIKRGSLFVQK